MQRNGLSPASEQLAEFAEIPISDVEDLLAWRAAQRQHVSLQGVVESKSVWTNGELVDVCPVMNFHRWSRAEIAERTASVWTLLGEANLTPKERTVVTLRFRSRWDP